MDIITGTLDPFFETGTEGVIWSVYEDGKKGYDGLHCLQGGDYLIIFDKSNPSDIVWEGNIDYDWDINYRKYPLNPQYGQQAVSGFWVHGIQRGLVPETWGNWFFKEYPAKLIRANFGHFYPLKSSTLSSYSWSGKGGLFDEGESGDLIIRFKSGAYYRYKDVTPKIFWEFYEAPSKGKYFAENIKDKFITEKLKLPNKSDETV